MNYLIERIVKEYHYHHETLGSFCRITLEVYFAYLFERLIEHFHETIWKLLKNLLWKVKECREVIAAEIIPGIVATVQMASARPRQTVIRYWDIVMEFYYRILRKH